ncbi:MAG: outer membrane protein [Humidesulfovibrio sp.]
MGYALPDNLVLDLGYRYTSFGDAKSVSNAASSVNFHAKDLNSHEALPGLRCRF